MATDQELLADELISKLEEKEFDTAYELLKTIKDEQRLTGENYHSVAIHVASTLAENREYDKAVSLFDESASFGNPEPEDLILYAASLYEKNRTDDARRVLGEIGTALSDDVRFWSLSGLCEYFSDDCDYEQAVEYFQKAEAIDAEWAENYFIADSLRRLQRYDESIPYFERGIQDNPNAAMPRYWYGLSLYFTDDYDGAIQAMHDAIRIDENLMYPYIDLARIYIERGEKERALPLIEKGIELGHPDAKDELTKLIESTNNEPGDEGHHAVEQQQEEVSADGYPYFNFPEDEPLKSIHSAIQKTYDSAKYSFPSAIMLKIFGLITAAVLMTLIGVYTAFQDSDYPAATDVAMVAKFDTEFADISVFNGESGLKRSVRQGTPLKAVAWRSGQMVVELPNGERGLVNTNYLNLKHQGTLYAGTQLFDGPTGNTVIKVIEDDETRAVSLVTADALNSGRYPVRLSDGSRGYINRSQLRADIHTADIPVINYSNKRLYDIHVINRDLAGADMNTVVRKMGIPIGFQNDRATQSGYMIFTGVRLFDDGKLSAGAAVQFSDGYVAQVHPQGTAKSLRGHQLELAPRLIRAGLPNYWIKEIPWNLKNSWFERFETTVRGWSAVLWWVLYILIVLVLLAIMAFSLYGIFGIPALMVSPVILALGKLPFVRNGMLKGLSWVLLAVCFYFLYQLTVIGFNLSWGYFGLGVYAFIVLAVFVNQSQLINDYVHTVRCPDCRIWHSMRDLGSVYAGYSEDITYEDVYKGTSYSGNVRTHHYETQRKVSYRYHYRDYYGCRKCGSSWSFQVTKYTRRGDMYHQ